jgi:hypothetical protein
MQQKNAGKAKSRKKGRSEPLGIVTGRRRVKDEGRQRVSKLINFV